MVDEGRKGDTLRFDWSPAEGFAFGGGRWTVDDGRGRKLTPIEIRNS
jgi:hypothetical protein